MGGRSSKNKAKAYKYHMSVHAGICVGPVDEVREIRLNDKVVWKGVLRESRTINIDSQELFGGLKKEGGVSGAFTVMFGHDSQKIPAGLRKKFGALADKLPDYRNMTTIFFHERVEHDGILLADWDRIDALPAETITAPEPQNPFQGIFASLFSRVTSSQSEKGFYWQANNPYLKNLVVVVSRSAKGLDRRYAKVPRLTAATSGLISDVLGSLSSLFSNSTFSDGSQPYDTNPAHIIFELLTSKDFGAGKPLHLIDVESFELAARTLYAEGFGLSMKWINQSKVKDMILEVLDHIQGVCFEDPETGLIRLRLLRGGYNVADLPVANKSNSKVINFQRKHDELINEVVVTYTDPDSFTESSVTVQDLAGAAVQGGIVSTGRNYYGVRSRVLAQILGERDLRAESYPLASCEIELDRSFWKTLPGDLLILDSPNDSEDPVVMRVLKAEENTGGRSSIRASLIEDVFSLEFGVVPTVPSTLFVDPDGEPQPANIVEVYSIPYSISSRLGLGQYPEGDYPLVRSMVLASTTQEEASEYDLMAPVVGPLGGTTEEIITTNSFVSRAILVDPLAEEAQTVISSFADRSPGPVPDVETILVIGNGDEDGQELAGITAQGANGYTVRRGLLDTIPRAWPAGTPVWLVASTATVWDASERAAFETPQYRLLTKTPKGTLAAASAPVVGDQLSERPYLPYRPANVSVGGTAFGTLDLREVAPAAQAVTWANRNRQSEDSVFLRWDDASVAVEAGQTTTIRVADAAGNMLTEHAGLTGTSFALPYASLQGGGPEVFVHVLSERDGRESLQSHKIRVLMPGGYGMNYGYAYGA